jgi:hypothetical protein
LYLHAGARTSSQERQSKKNENIIAIGKKSSSSMPTGFSANTRQNLHGQINFV